MVTSTPNRGNAMRFSHHLHYKSPPLKHVWNYKRIIWERKRGREQCESIWASFNTDKHGWLTWKPNGFYTEGMSWLRQTLLLITDSESIHFATHFISFHGWTSRPALQIFKHLRDFKSIISFYFYNLMQHLCLLIILTTADSDVVINLPDRPGTWKQKIHTV